MTQDKSIKEIAVDSSLATEVNIEEITGDVLGLKEGESLFVNGHQILYTDDMYKVGTSFGDLQFYDADSAARFCVRMGFPQGAARIIDDVDLDDKLTRIKQRLERVESRLT